MTTPTTATSAAPWSASSPTPTPTAVFELSAEERKERILESLSHYYGPEAKNPVVYYESDWGSEEWTRGAYAASFDMGGLHRYGAGPPHGGRPDPLRVQRHGRRRVPARRRAIRMGHLVASNIVDASRDAGAVESGS